MAYDASDSGRPVLWTTSCPPLLLALAQKAKHKRPQNIRRARWGWPWGG